MNYVLSSLTFHHGFSGVTWFTWFRDDFQASFDSPQPRIDPRSGSDPQFESRTLQCLPASGAQYVDPWSSVGRWGWRIKRRCCQKRFRIPEDESYRGNPGLVVDDFIVWGFLDNLLRYLHNTMKMGCSWFHMQPEVLWPMLWHLPGFEEEVMLGESLSRFQTEDK